jgi:hypothetical protein
MKEIGWPAPCGYTVFCDDIRQEVGGKPSYMGVYMGRMLIGATFPLAMPKFVCAVHYFETPDAASTPLELRIFFPGDPEDAPTYRMSVSVPQPTLDQLQMPSMEEELDDPRVVLQFPVVFAPFPILQEGILKVRMFRGENEVVRLGALKIETQPGLNVVDALAPGVFVQTPGPNQETPPST